MQLRVRWYRVDRDGKLREKQKEQDRGKGNICRGSERKRSRLNERKVQVIRNILTCSGMSVTFRNECGFWGQAYGLGNGAEGLGMCNKDGRKSWVMIEMHDPYMDIDQELLISITCQVGGQ